MSRVCTPRTLLWWSDGCLALLLEFKMSEMITYNAFLDKRNIVILKGKMGSKEELGKQHGFWCPGSSHRHDISILTNTCREMREHIYHVLVLIHCPWWRNMASWNLVNTGSGNSFSSFSASRLPKPCSADLLITSFLETNLQWNLNQNIEFSFQENAFENVVCNMSAIWYSHCVD